MDTNPMAIMTIIKVVLVLYIMNQTLRFGFLLQDMDINPMVITMITSPMDMDMTLTKVCF